MKILDFEMAPNGIILDMNPSSKESISESAVDSRSALMANLREVVDKIKSATYDISFTAEDNSTVMVECFDIQRTVNKLMALTFSAVGAYAEIEQRYYNDASIALLPWSSKLKQVSEMLKKNGVDLCNMKMKRYRPSNVAFAASNKDFCCLKDEFFSDPFSVLPATNVISLDFDKLYQEDSTTLNVFAQIAEGPVNACHDDRGCLDAFSSAAKMIFMKLYDAQSLAYDTTEMSGARKLLAECARATINMQAAMIETVMYHGLAAYNAMRQNDTICVLALHADSLIKEAQSNEVKE